LRRVAHAAADVSDGLLADGANIAAASGLGLEIDLDRLPLSPGAQRWIANQPDDALARAALAAAGDDYELVIAVAPEFVEEACAGASDPPLTVIGRFVSTPGLKVRFAGVALVPAATGWRHV
jgi:thiamine-monophosphate kinase